MLLENRETHEMEVYLTAYREKQNYPVRGQNADCYKYTLTFL